MQKLKRTLKVVKLTKNCPEIQLIFFKNYRRFCFLVGFSAILRQNQPQSIKNIFKEFHYIKQAAFKWISSEARTVADWFEQRCRSCFIVPAESHLHRLTTQVSSNEAKFISMLQETVCGRSCGYFIIYLSCYSIFCVVSWSSH